MKIPRYLKTHKFYVAESITKAASSWNTLRDAEACVGRLALLHPMGFKRCKGIIRVDNEFGRIWVWRKIVI